MSTISGVGSAGSAWADVANSRASAMKQKMFAKVDTDASGGIDKSELAGMLDKLSQKSGQALGDAGELFGTLDGDGDGSLSADELDAGLKDLMPPPPSTMAFVQNRSGDSGSAASALFDKLDADGSGGLDADELNTLLDRIAAQESAGDDGSSLASTSSQAITAQAQAAVFEALDTDGDGNISRTELESVAADRPTGPPPGDRMPPPGPPPTGAGSGAASGSESSSASTSSSSSSDPLDTNQDGVVSARERAAGALKDLLSALNDNRSDDGTSSLSTDEASRLLNQLASALAADGASTGGGASDDSGGNAATGHRAGKGLAALTSLVREAYADAAQDAAQSQGVDVAA